MDEFLLAKAEKGEMGETLRFWEAKEHFIVVGRAGKVKEDCFTGRCLEDGVRILRRVSGGGTVLQGPGCLNYSAVLSYERGNDFKDIRTSYNYILGKISDNFKAKGVNVDFFPVSDLALGGKKVSGNAQARKKRFFLHHGTFFYAFDLPRVASYLKHPSSEPEYRNSRPHKDFLTNLPISGDRIKRSILEVFSASETSR
ncbi:MAG: lipoate--protein ligase family protein, partial [Candidatus Omnitrophota bacterium]